MVCAAHRAGRRQRLPLRRRHRGGGGGLMPRWRTPAASEWSCRSGAAPGLRGGCSRPTPEAAAWRSTGCSRTLGRRPWTRCGGAHRGARRPAGGRSAQLLRDRRRPEALAEVAHAGGASPWPGRIPSPARCCQPRRVRAPTSPSARGSRWASPLSSAVRTCGFMAVARTLLRRMPGRLVGLHRRPRRATRLHADPADPRAAHPPREGHQQHLHQPGADGAGRHRLHGADGRRRHAPRGRGQRAGAHAFAGS